MHLEKIRLDQIQNGRLSAIITWPIFGKPCSMAKQIITIKQNVRVWGTMHPEIFKLVYIEFKMTVNQPLVTWID